MEHLVQSDNNDTNRKENSGNDTRTMDRVL